MANKKKGGGKAKQHQQAPSASSTPAANPSVGRDRGQQQPAPVPAIPGAPAPGDLFPSLGQSAGGGAGRGGVAWSRAAASAPTSGAPASSVAGLALSGPSPPSAAAPAAEAPAVTAPQSTMPSVGPSVVVPAGPPSRASSGNVASDILTSVMYSKEERGVSSKAVVTAKRPGLGTAGMSVTLRANYFAVNFKNILIYHYDVDISPYLPSRALRRVLLCQIVANHNAEFGGEPKRPALPVFDGNKNLYSARALAFELQEFRTTLEDKDKAEKDKPGKDKAGKEGKGKGPMVLAGGGPPGVEGGEEEGRRGRARSFKVTIKLAAKYDCNNLKLYLEGRYMSLPMEIIQALDVCLRERPVSRLLPVGPSFYSDKIFGSAPLGNGVTAFKGFYQSLRPAQRGLVLNVDMTATAFLADVEFLTFAQEFLQKRGAWAANSTLSDEERRRLKKVVRGVKVVVTHRETQRRYRISDITREPSSSLSFSVNGQNTSLVQYFLSQYQKRIAYPKLPCLVSGQGDKKNYLPMEFCRVVHGQKFTGKLNESQVTSLLRFTCKKPKERESDVMLIGRENQYQSDPYASEFGVSVTASSLLEVQGRVLNSPTLVYAPGKEIQPRQGAWNMLDGLKVVEGAKIQHWAVLNFCPPHGRTGVSPDSARTFQQALQRRCTELGITMNPNPVAPSPMNGNLHNVSLSLPSLIASLKKNIPQGQWLQLVIIMLPERVFQYPEIKRLCDTQLNVASQCCLSKHVFKCQSQYLANLAFKINVKCGGKNVALKQEMQRAMPFVSDTPTIIFGADVSHPAPGNDTNPSLASVVASRDWPFISKYGCLLRTQAHRQEVISGLHMERVSEGGAREYGGIIRSLLMEFYQACRQKPNRIIFFRDGVSEGQFETVLSYELSAIKKACLTMDPSQMYSPKVTFIVVQKRHHTRLFPAGNCPTDRSGNVLPGTVVDSSICHPREFDFFLNSHAGIQGTSRPTHYRVLYDECGFSSDSLQSFCNSISYTFARCTRSVSVVPPVYYADLAAERARLYLESLEDSAGDSGSERGFDISGRGVPSLVLDSAESSSSTASSRCAPPPVPTLPVVMDVPRRGMFFC